MITYTKKITRSGNGFVVRIPKDITHLLKLGAGDYVKIDIEKIIGDDKQ